MAAWRLNHCVYCGEVFPPDFKAGFEEPESLKWVNRPEIPADAAKQLEMMKIVPMEGRQERRAATFLGLAAIPIFAGLFYLMYRVVERHSAATANLILVAGAGFIVYLAWAVFKRSS